MKKIIYAVAAIIMTILTLFLILSLSVILKYADFHRGKWVVCVIFLIFVAGFGLVAVKLYKKLFEEKRKSDDNKNEYGETLTFSTVKIQENQAVKASPAKNKKQAENIISVLPMDISIQSQETPREILMHMRECYSIEQAKNDLRIVKESVEIMGITCDLDVFLSRYEMAMQCVLTLLQAKQAGMRITLSDDFQDTLINAKKAEMGKLLKRSFKKEFEEISNLKTTKGKINKIVKYKEKLESLYEEEIEFVAEEEYGEIMSKLELMKKECESQ